MDERIEELLIKKIDGELTVDEEREFREWLDQSEVHERTWLELENVRKRLNVLREEFHPDVQGRLALVKKRGKRRKRLIVILGRYVALWIILMCVSLFWWNRERDENVCRTFDKVAIPGTERAHVVLGDGMRVVIDQTMKDTVLQGKEGWVIRIDSNKVLHYDAGKVDGEREIKKHRLVIPCGGEYRIVLDDGSVVWLNSASSLELPERFAGNVRWVRLMGEGYFKVQRDSSRPFCVETDRGSVWVLGTEFNVSAYEEEGNMVTTLVDGVVRVELQAGETVMLKPGEQALMTGDSIAVRKIDVEFETSWVTGKFCFNDTRLEDIARQVSRWYDVKILFEEEVLKEVRFSGAMLKFRPLSDLIEMIEATSFVRFVVKDDYVVVMKR